MRLSSFKIKQIRLEMGMNQSQFCLLLGFKQAYLSKVETGAKLSDEHHLQIKNAYNDFLNQRIKDLEEELIVLKSKIITDSSATTNQVLPTKSANGDYLLSVKHQAIRSLYEVGSISDEEFNKWILSEDPSFTPKIKKLPPIQ